MSVAAPADKRFRRAHVTPARRARLLTFTWRKAARAAVLLAILIYAAYRAVFFLLNAEALTITRIDVSGNSRLSKGEVVSLLDGLRGTNMVMVDLETWRQKLLTSSPWVADAGLRRVLPGTVAVDISEREPMGIGRVNNELYLIDDRGEIIDQFGPLYAEFDLPIIDGLSVPGDGDSQINQAKAALAARVLTSLRSRPDLVKRVSEIDVSDVRNAVLILKGDTVLVRVGNEQFAERLQSYLDLVPALRERVAAIDYVDLRFDERVYVRSQAHAAASARVRSTAAGRK